MADPSSMRFDRRELAAAASVGALERGATARKVAAVERIQAAQRRLVGRVRLDDRRRGEVHVWRADDRLYALCRTCDLPQTVLCEHAVAVVIAHAAQVGWADQDEPDEGSVVEVEAYFDLPAAIGLSKARPRTPAWRWLKQSGAWWTVGEVLHRRSARAGRPPEEVREVVRGWLSEAVTLTEQAEAAEERARERWSLPAQGPREAMRRLLLGRYDWLRETLPPPIQLGRYQLYGISDAVVRYSEPNARAWCQAGSGRGFVEVLIRQGRLVTDCGASVLEHRCSLQLRAVQRMLDTVTAGVGDEAEALVALTTPGWARTLGRLAAVAGQTRPGLELSGHPAQLGWELDVYEEQIWPVACRPKLRGEGMMFKRLDAEQVNAVSPEHSADGPLLMALRMLAGRRALDRTALPALVGHPRVFGEEGSVEIRNEVVTIEGRGEGGGVELTVCVGGRPIEREAWSRWRASGARTVSCISSPVTRWWSGC